MCLLYFLFFFFNDPATTEIYTLSLHDALPISNIMRLLLIQPILLGLGGLAKATLESFDRFTLPAVGSNLYNVGIIGGALLAPWLGIAGLVWGVVAGAALFLLAQLPGLRQVGWRYRAELR